MQISDITAKAYENYSLNTKKPNEAGFDAVLKKAFDEKDAEKLQEVCKQFESIFVGMMMKQMRATVMKTDLMGNSNAQEIFESMLDEEYSKEATKTEGVGIAAMMYQQMRSQVENFYQRDKE